MSACCREAGAVGNMSNGTAAQAATAAATPSTSQTAAATTTTSSPAATADRPAAATAGGVSSAGLRPFAVVDEVADGSPAATAGIQLGDQLCRWDAVGLLPGHRAAVWVQILQHQSMLACQ